MKKLVSVLLCIAMLLSLACVVSAETEETTAPEIVWDENQETILLEYGATYGEGEKSFQLVVDHLNQVVVCTVGTARSKCKQHILDEDCFRAAVLYSQVDTGNQLSVGYGSVLLYHLCLSVCRLCCCAGSQGICCLLCFLCSGKLFQSDAAVCKCFCKVQAICPLLCHLIEREVHTGRFL